LTLTARVAWCPSGTLRSKTGRSAWGDDWGGKFDPSHPEPFVSWIANIRRVVCDLPSPQSMEKGVAPVLPTPEAHFWRAPPEVVGNPIEPKGGPVPTAGAPLPAVQRSPPARLSLGSVPPARAPVAAPPLRASPAPRPLSSPGAWPVQRPPQPGSGTRQPSQQPSQQPSSQPGSRQPGSQPPSQKPGLQQPGSQQPGAQQPSSSPNPAPAKESGRPAGTDRAVSDNTNYWQQLQGTPVLIVTPSRKQGSTANAAPPPGVAGCRLPGFLAAVLLALAM
jgi:hypothetical protein